MACFRHCDLRKMAAPGMYYVVSPFLAAFGVFLLCSFVVYVAIPLAGRLGLFFNDADRRKHKRIKLKKKLKIVLALPLQEVGLTWGDLEDTATEISCRANVVGGRDSNRRIDMELTMNPQVVLR